MDSSSKRAKPIVGVGLRPTHYQEIAETDHPVVEWFEVISENYMDSEGQPMDRLEIIRRDFPLATHGVSMNLVNPQGLDVHYLNTLKGFVERIDPIVVSDHLCWTRTSAHGNIHDLLPLPYTQEVVDVAVENIDRLQSFLGRKFSIENVSTYLRYKHSEMSEWEFINEIQRRTGCGLLVDVNNIYVNSFNHGFDPDKFVDAVPIEAIEQIHLAGHTDMGDYLFDTHSKPVTSGVWKLFERLMARLPEPKPFLVEWDDDIPPFEDLVSEAQIAAKIVEARYA